MFWINLWAKNYYHVSFRNCLYIYITHILKVPMRDLSPQNNNEKMCCKRKKMRLGTQLRADRITNCERPKRKQLNNKNKFFFFFVAAGGSLKTKHNTRKIIIIFKSWFTLTFITFYVRARARDCEPPFWMFLCAQIVCVYIWDGLNFYWYINFDCDAAACIG